MMKLLITGATGFAGNVLLDLLPKSLPDTRVTAFVLPGDPGETRIRNKHIRHLHIVYGDIADTVAVEKAVAGQSHVVHLAGLISYWSRERAELTRVNEKGVENVVNACLNHRLERLVHVSSVGAVGFHRDGRLADEETEFNWPESFPYMTSKYAGQRIVEKAVEEHNLPAIILNPASLMGPGDPIYSTPHNQLYARIYHKTMFGCFAGGLAITDVRDLARIIIKALTMGRVGEKYLIVGSNVEYTTVVKAIGMYFGRKVYPFRVPGFVLAAGGSLMEFISGFTGKRPLLPRAYGRLSGWFGYYSNRKSRVAFQHQYLPFDKTIADGCRYFQEQYG
ncbi:MAG: NAD-dependent epimerase/dehydratase family protein [Spirochaetaceae bacterium]|nr:MAG: NAD-dependent epimerase/dehydratase family protein [Spirochaetaceae bacterium]